MAALVSFKRKGDVSCLDDTPALPAKRQRKEESEKVVSVAETTISLSNSNNSQSTPSLSDRISLLNEHAEDCMEENNFDEAIKIYASIPVGDPVSQAKVCFNWAVALHERDGEGDLEEEIAVLKKGLSAKLEEEDIELAGEILDNLGDAYLSFKDYPKALETFSKGARLLEKTQGRLLARMRNGMGLACERMDNVQEAVKNYRAGLLVKHNDTLLKIGLVHNYCTNFDLIPLSEGIGLVYGALTLPMENTLLEERNRLKAQMFWQLGNMLLKREGEGDLAVAIRSCEQAVEFEHGSQKVWEELLNLVAQAAKLDPKQTMAYYRTEANMDIRAVIYNVLGEALLAIEDYERAAQNFQAALLLLQTAPDSARKARLFSLVGYALEGADDREKAAIAFRIGVQVKHDNALLRAQMLYNLAQHEPPLEAEKCLREALELTFDHDETRRKLFCDLGNLYMLRMENATDVERAIKCYDAAAKLGQDHPAIRLRLYEKLANMQCHAQDLSGGERSLKQCLVLAKNPLMEARTCLNLAKLFVQRAQGDDLDQAIEFLVRGINGEHNDSFLEAEMRYILASVFIKRDLEGKLDDIISHLERARKIAESELPQHKQAHQDLDLRLRILSSLAEAYLRDPLVAEENLQKVVVYFQTCLKMKGPDGKDIPLLQSMRAQLEHSLSALQAHLQQA